MPNPGHSAAVLSAAFALALAAQAAPARAASELFFVSTYIAPPAAGQPPVDRSGNGIYAVRLDTVSGALTGLGMKAPLDRASWLAANPKRPVIYSVADSGGGITTESEVRSFVADPATGALKPLNKVGSGGRDATHLAIDPASMTLFAANHDTGQVTAFPLLPDGAVGPLASSQQDVGTGPHPRQNRPQAHAVVIDPSGHYLIDNDFGADRIFVRPFDGKTRTIGPAAADSPSSPAGTGPRHLAFHPNGKIFYVNTEIGSTVLVYRWDAAAGRLTLQQTAPLYPADYPKDRVKSSSELVVSKDGRFLYVSLRGDQDSLVVFAIDPAGGALTEIQRLPSGGRSPRSFTLDPTGRFLLLGNELTNTVNLFRVDPATGKLAPTDQSVPMPAPVAFTSLGG